MAGTLAGIWRSQGNRTWSSRWRELPSRRSLPSIRRGEETKGERGDEGNRCAGHGSGLLSTWALIAARGGPRLCAGAGGRSSSPRTPLADRGIRREPAHRQANYGSAAAPGSRRRLTNQFQGEIRVNEKG